MTKLPNPRRNTGSDALTIEWVKSNCRVDANGCWLWLGSLDGKGYGHVRVGQRSTRVHIVACGLVGRPLPAGLVSDHLCRAPSCCNPDHIEHVTAHENTRRGASVKHAGGSCARCGSANLFKRRWGVGCRDCTKRYEQTPARVENRREYEKARAQTDRRKEQRARALAKWAEKRRAARLLERAEAVQEGLPL